jgi:hypothetical protein
MITATLSKDTDLERLLGTVEDAMTRKVLALADVVPAIPGDGVPRSLGPGGTPFPIYVLDLSVVLPAVVATGVLLVRRHPAGPLLGAVVLAKIVTLGLAMEAAAVVLVLTGGGPIPPRPRCSRSWS